MYSMQYVSVDFRYKIYLRFQKIYLYQNLVIYGQIFLYSNIFLYVLGKGLKYGGLKRGIVFF